MPSRGSLISCFMRVTRFFLIVSCVVAQVSLLNPSPAYSFLPPDTALFVPWKSQLSSSSYSVTERVVLFRFFENRDDPHTVSQAQKMLDALQQKPENEWVPEDHLLMATFLTYNGENEKALEHVTRGLNFGKEPRDVNILGIILDETIKVPSIYWDEVLLVHTADSLKSFLHLKLDEGDADTRNVMQELSNQLPVDLMALLREVLDVPEEKWDSSFHRKVEQFLKRYKEFRKSPKKFAKRAKTQPVEPKMASYFYTLQGMLHENNGKGMFASLAYQQAKRVYPNYYRSHLQYGKLMFRDSLEKPDQKFYIQAAEKGLERALKLNPNSGEVYHWLGKLYVQKRQYDKSQEMYQKAALLKLGDDSLAIEVGDLYFKFLKDNKKALEFYTLALQWNPNSDPAHFQMAKVFESNDMKDQAETHYQTAIRLAPKKSEYRWEFARFYERQKSFAKAEEQYLEAIQNNPDDPENHFRLGGFYMSQGKKQFADREYRKSLAINRTDPEFLLSISKFLYRKRWRKEQEEVLKKALKMYPEDHRFHFEMALFYMDDRSTVPKAKPYLEKVLKLNPLHMPAIRLAEKFNRMQPAPSQDEFTENLKKAADAEPESIDRLMDYAYNLLARKKWDLAKQQYEKALAMNPNSIKVHAYIGYWHLYQGKNPAPKNISKKPFYCIPNRSLLQGGKSPRTILSIF